MCWRGRSGTSALSLGSERSAGCAFVHMQYGATGRNTVFCTFGGGVREVKLDVLYCTDYRNRNVAPRLERIGFAPEMRGSEVEV